MISYLIGAIIGAGSGFAYYYYIGCVSGVCPIQTNPWLSMAFGTAFGVLIIPDLINYLKKRFGQAQDEVSDEEG